MPGSDTRLKQDYARRRMVECEQNSPDWLFWRAICLGMEDSIFVTQKWAEDVLRLWKEAQEAVNARR